MVGDNQRPFFEEWSATSTPWFSNPPGFVAEVQHQPLDIVLAQALQVIVQFLAGGFGKAQDLEVGDPRLHPEGIRHALAADVVARDGEGKVIGRASRETTILTLVPRCP